MGLPQKKPVGRKNSVGSAVCPEVDGWRIDAKTPPGCDCGEWGAEVEQVVGCWAVQTAVHHDAELVLDSLGYIEPMQLSVQQPR